MKRLIHTTSLLATIGLLTAPAVATPASPVGWPVTVLYVDDDAPCPGDGLSWDTAYCDLQLALDYAFTHPEVDEIRVAHGTYYPDRGTGIREWTFQLLSDLALNGGYRGLTPCDPNDPNEPNDPDHRDVGACKSILSGEIGSPDVTTDNSYHVVSGTGTDATASIDGFTITAGRADGSSPHDNGAGLVNFGGSPVISNCTFTDNYASDDGAGVLYVGDGTDVVFTGCTFTDNYAVDDDAGMSCNGGGGNLLLTGCTFSGNSCASSVAGFGATNCGNVTVTDCSFTNNSAGGNVAGGMHVDNSGDVTLTNCAFSGNSAPNRGGGLHLNSSGTLYLTNCHFENNSVSATTSNNGRGGGVYCQSVIADNCTFTGNTASSSGGAGEASAWGGGVYATRPTTLISCLFTDNSASARQHNRYYNAHGGAVYVSADATATDCSFAANTASAAGYGPWAYWSAWGGAVWSDATVTLIRCTLTDNTAEYTYSENHTSNARGGAVYANILEATDCQFGGNSAWNAGNYGGQGGAVWANAATTGSCGFANNSVSNAGYYECQGGALYIRDGFTVATVCTFEGNTADYQGGAIFREGGVDIGTITGCLFQSNTCGGYGGAIRQWLGNLDLDHCIFEANTAGASGGAIIHDGSSESIADCIFVNNTADTDGGAMRLGNGCSPWIVNCSFHGNDAVGYGGALACADGSSPKLINSVLTGNQGYLGGAVYCFNNSAAELANSTFVCNTATIIGGALYIDSSQVVVDNCILWDNSPNQVTDLQNQVQINYCDIQGGWPTGMGNMDTDPLFVDADGEDDICGTVDDDLRLLPASPCIDAGDDTRVPLDELDLDCDFDTAERIPVAPRDLRPPDDPGGFDWKRRFTDRPGTVDTGVAEPPDYPQVVDMGAYEYCCLGDLDGDCDVDLGDLAKLLAFYRERNVGYDHGDLNLDEVVDLSDIAALLSVYRTECE